MFGGRKIMQSSLKKSLYLGLAALSFASVAAVSTTASAKSYATAGSYTTLTADATKRNVEATGTNALYTKPGTVKGAKVVASKATMATLASSKKSTDYFRAYGQKVTNRGSVYYRVVTMDGKYRGYIYGGKAEGTFAGGIKSAETTTKAALPTNKTVYFANPGKTNVTWNAPKNTQYKASKMVTNTTPFAGDTLTITDAVTKTREGSLYYYVKDAQHPSVNGWIFSKAVTADKSVSFNQATDIKVNFVNPDGTSVATSSLQALLANNTANTAVGTAKANAVGTAVGFDAQNKATDAWGVTALKGTGYVYTAATASNQAALLSAKTGDTVTLTVAKAADAVQSISAYYQVGTTVNKLASVGTDGVALNLQVTFPKLAAAFSGATGSSYAANDVVNFLTTNKVTTLTSADYAKDADGNVVATDASNAVKGNDGKVTVYHTVYTLTSGVAGSYTKGGVASAFYNTAKEVTGTGATTSNTGDVSIFG